MNIFNMKKCNPSKWKWKSEQCTASLNINSPGKYYFFFLFMIHSYFYCGTAFSGEWFFFPYKREIQLFLFLDLSKKKSSTCFQCVLPFFRRNYIFWNKSTHYIQLVISCFDKLRINNLAMTFRKKINVSSSCA